MKTVLSVVLTAITGALYAADANPSNQVHGAIAKLKDQASYSWTVKTELAGMDFTPEPQTGKVTKDGIALVSQNMFGQDAQAAFKGEKVAVLVEGNWQAATQSDGMDFANPGAMTARFLAGTGTAVEDAGYILARAKDLKTGEGGLLSGDLTEAGAKDLLAFGRRRGGSSGGAPAGPGPQDAKGTVKFWLKDGALVKYQSHLTGKMSFMPDQEPQNWDVTRTVEVSGVGSTKVEIPEAARKIVEAK